MSRRDELLRNAREATANYAAAKERHDYARRMVALGMTADVFGACVMESRAYSEWLKATDAFHSYRG